MAKTSKKDFAEFKTCFQQYQRLFGLNDYSIGFEHIPLMDAAAAIQIDHDGRFAAVALCTEFPDLMTKKGHIEEWARHECIHLLLADHRAILEDPASTNTLKARSEESMVIRLESIIDNLT